MYVRHLFLSDWYVVLKKLKSFDQSCICFLFGTKVCISLHVCMPFEEILGVCVLHSIK